MVVPYQLALLPSAPNPPPLALLVLGALVNTGLQIAGAVGIGLLAARAVGLRAPVFEALASGANVRRSLRESHLARAAILGVVVSLIVIALAVTIFSDATSAVTAKASAPGRLVGFLASFEGRHHRGDPAAAVRDVGRRVAAHADLARATAWCLLDGEHRRGGPLWLGSFARNGGARGTDAARHGRAIVLNAVIGVVCGWLYWRDGLEAAMVAHFSGDVVLHVIAGA